MIIQEIKYSSGFFFKKPEIVIVTDEGKKNLNIVVNKEQVKKLNSALAGTKINSLQDLEKIKKDINDILPKYTD